MGLFDQLEGAVQNAINQQGGLNAVLSQAVNNAGGYQGILTKLNQAGMGDQVSSWLGSGKNLPISADQIQAALGNEHLQQLASSLGVPVDQVAPLLAQHLPTAISQASPDGNVPPPSTPPAAKSS